MILLRKSKVSSLYLLLGGPSCHPQQFVRIFSERSGKSSDDVAGKQPHIYNQTQGNDNSDQFLLRMRASNEKQQPFHVKRARMRDSIIKCKQIISNYSNLSSKLKRNNYEMNSVQEDQETTQMKYKKEGSIVNQHDLLNNRATNFKISQMKDMIKMYQCKRLADAAHQMVDNGIAVKKIDKDYTPSRNTRARTEYQERVEKLEGFTITELNCTNTHRTLDKVEVKQPIQLKAHQKQEDQLMVKSVHPPLTMSHQSNSIRYRPKNLAIVTHTTSVQPRLQVSQVRSKKLLPKQLNVKTTQKQYLYQRMANFKVQDSKRFNPIYDRRIKSYTQFLWKMMLAHNVYLSLDLSQPLPFSHKVKAYIGLGNNCNMIKGLIKRRFWWVLSEEMTEDCFFVWTQLKNNKIFRRQQSAPENTIKIIQPTENTINQCKPTKRACKKQKKRLIEHFNFNRKIWTASDCCLFQDYFLQNQLLRLKQEDETSSNVCINFCLRSKQISANLKQITSVELPYSLSPELDVLSGGYYRIKPIVHNHVENNFHLGNKKALFHNLKYYYSKIGEDPFDYIPLTFHIVHGFRDMGYKRFIKYYKKRDEKIKLRQETGFLKNRNIWIVKPGQNSNRGKGITVIDQIYELDNIMKKALKKRKSAEGSEGAKTFIVQMYLDRPLLYNDRKFDIRHYMLITNIYGVTRAYWYEEGYIRTSSYPFSIHNFQPQIHLTNDAIQQQYPDYGRYQPYNKISYSQFQSYLNASERRYDFKNDLLPKMKKMATDAAKSVYLRINPNQQMHNFQIFGLDFMIDNSFRPWLIEINTNPCLDCSCPLLNRIIPYMVEQSLKLSLDVVYPPPSHYPNSAKHLAPYVSLETFKYELIFDSLAEGQELLNKTGGIHRDISLEIGQIDDDEVFKDDGSQIKLEDYV